MSLKIVKMINVNSQSIKQIGYFRKQMVIVFMNGDKYTFDKIPRDLFDEFKGAQSIGAFFIDKIKGNFIGAKA